MSTIAKTRIVVTGLVLFTLWPVVHLYLVAEYDLSPWKLAGWGMYAAPRPNYRGMEVFGLADENGARQRLGAPSAAMRDEAGRFLERYRWLRRLARPDALADAIRDARPDWKKIQIVVYRSHVDPETGMVVMKDFTYEYAG